MAVRINSTTLLGIEAVPVDVETEVMSGLRKFNIVGLPDGVVKEAKDRVRCALENSGFQFPNDEVIVSLAPASLPKLGSGFDVAIALSVLAGAGGISPEILKDLVFVGELALDGRIKEVGSELASAVLIKKSKSKLTLVVSSKSRGLLQKFQGLSVFYASSLLDLVSYLKKENYPEIQRNSYKLKGDSEKKEKVAKKIPTFRDVVGQFAAKRALQIVAAGGHNMLMVGPPGSGKTMLAERIISLLPELEDDEFLEINQIYSALKGQGVSGFSQKSIISERPFRAPHHSTSLAGLIGGGSLPLPGELTLAHKGVLFLDEFPELRRDVMESLREPLESSKVSISRAKMRITYPCNFMLIAAMNPCPCGKKGMLSEGNSHTSRFKSLCECAPQSVSKYLRKLSGPIMDRIDVQIWIPQVSIKDLRQANPEDVTERLREGVLTAREVQKNRYKGTGKLNSEMSGEEVNEYCRLSKESENLLDSASSKFSLSARAYTRILKLSRTIADINGESEITSIHLSEAISYRVKLASHLG